METLLSAAFECISMTYMDNAQDEVSKSKVNLFRTAILYILSVEKAFCESLYLFLIVVDGLADKLTD
ncbi:MAG: hypothetical protein AB2693_31485 [Candidatus Thiodiazotropha sp.]